MAALQPNAKQTPKDALKCAFCQSVLKNPKLLHCFHIGCNDCITKQIQERQGQLSVHCPSCQHTTFLPDETSVSDLQSAFHINHILKIQATLATAREPQNALCGKCTKSHKPATSYCHDCGEFVCGRCSDIHREWVDFATHTVVPLEQLEESFKQQDTLRKVDLYCSLHDGKQLELYCEVCEELICHNCTVSKHCRPEHRYSLVDDTFEQHKAEITKSLEPVENQLSIVNKTLEHLDQQMIAMNEKRSTTESQVKKIFEKINEALEKQRAEMMSQLYQCTTQKVEKQKDTVEKMKSQLTSCLSFVRDSLGTDSKGEIMNMRKTVLKQIKEMTDDFKPEELPSSEPVDIRFTADTTEMIESIEHFGELYTNQALPGNCFARGQGIKTADPGETATLELVIVDVQGKPCSVRDKAISCELTHDPYTSTPKGPNKCNVKKIESDQYEISYQVALRGKYQLHIKIEGEYIRGSPFAVTVKTPIDKLGSPFKTIDDVKTPWGVAITRMNSIVVAETNSHRISIFSSNGEKLRSFGSNGLENGQFKKPCGVAVDSNDNILVVDSGNSRVQKFTLEGEFIAAVGKTGNDQLEFNNSLGVAVSPTSQKIFVVDNVNNRIQILNPDLTFSGSSGNFGIHDGEFTDPSDVACDETGNVYVADCGNNRIQVFNEKGDYLMQFNRKGSKSDKEVLDTPNSISIDQEGLVYVTELYKKCISVYTHEGAYQTSFSMESGEVHGIATDDKGVLYISDFENNCLQLL